MIVSLDFGNEVNLHELSDCNYLLVDWVAVVVVAVVDLDGKRPPLAKGMCGTVDDDATYFDRKWAGSLYGMFRMIDLVVEILMVLDHHHGAVPKLRMFPTF